MSLKNFVKSLFTIKKQEKPMFDKIFGALKKETGLPHITSLMNALNQVVAHFNPEYVKDQSARNGAIDALKDLLEDLKQKA